MRLKESLKQLEEAYLRIHSTSGYTKETEKMKILTELIKEQVRNENIDNTASQTR